MENDPRPAIHGIRPASVAAVVFDLGGVFLEGTLENVARFGARVGLSEQDWWAIREQLFLNGGPWEALERGEITLDRFAATLQAFLAERGVKVDAAVARDFMGSPGDAFRMRVREEVVAACRTVRSVMPTTLLTNNIVEWREGWRARMDVAGLFDLVVDSSEVGMRKPEERIYVLVEERMKMDGERLLFIDDLGMNLKPARARGWQTVKYDDTAKVLAVLDAVAAAKGGQPPGRA